MSDENLEEDLDEIQELEQEPEQDPPVLLTDEQRANLEKSIQNRKGFRKKRGLPPKNSTKRTEAECIAMLKAEKGYEHKAARKLGLSYQTWDKYKKRWPKLAKLVHDYDALRVEKVVQAGFHEAIVNKNDRMIRFILDRKGKDFGFAKEYKEEKAPNIVVNVGQQISIQLTDDVKNDMVDRIKRKRMSELERKHMDYGLKELARQDEAKVLEHKEIPPEDPVVSEDLPDN